MKNCIISWGIGLYDVKTNKKITHNVTDISIDSNYSIVNIVIESGKKVNNITFSMEHAQEIGFINIDVLSKFCK